MLKDNALLALLYTIDGTPTLLSPRTAHARRVALKVLNTDERDTLESIGEVLVPGARSAGLAEYVDHQLAVDCGECRLAARVLDIQEPASAFYRAALANVDGAARHGFGRSFVAHNSSDQSAFVTSMSIGDPDGWQGVPAPLVFFLLRNDAADVYYGTLEGYERIGAPCVAHLLPQTSW